MITWCMLNGKIKERQAHLAWVLVTLRITRSLWCQCRDCTYTGQRAGLDYVAENNRKVDHRGILQNFVDEILPSPYSNSLSKSVRNTQHFTQSRLQLRQVSNLNHYPTDFATISWTKLQNITISKNAIKPHSGLLLHGSSFFSPKLKKQYYPFRNRHNFKADFKISSSSGAKPINWLWTLSEQRQILKGPG